MKLGLFMLLVSVVFYGFIGSAHAATAADCADGQLFVNGTCSDTGCGENQVYQNNQCITVTPNLRNDLNLKADKPLYAQGGLVVITGLVKNIDTAGSGDVAVIVRAPDNNIVTIDQIHPNSDGSFQLSFKADGPQFKTAGTYTVSANFSALKSSITFEFTGGTGKVVSGGTPQPTTCPSGQILVNGKCTVKPITCNAGETLVNGKCVISEPEPEPEPTPEPEPQPTCGAGTELVNGICQVVKTEKPKGGGCLIATAAYGTELAPQVQFLREIRDNTVMSTSSGMAFMSGFNQFYYSFSPTIADLERENPMFQEAVRAFITPMISTLSIMTLAENGSDAEVLGLGISVIVLNLGMYIAAPTVVGFKVHKHLKSRK